MNTEWKYLWSIVRGTRKGDIYVKQSDTQWWDALYKVVLIEDGKELPQQESHEHLELDHCRVIAEEFVEGAVV
jgi:hypothetical protein